MALAFVVGFPGLVGGAGIGFNIGRSFDVPAMILLGYLPVAAAIVILITGLRSQVRVTPDAVSVRFLGFRATTIRFDELRSLTFEMAFPSISFALVLEDRSGHKTRIHANWWQDEGAIVRPVCRAALQRDVAMDRSAARVVSDVLGVKRPKATIVHHAWLNKGRTW